MLTSNSREEAAKELNYVLKTLFLRRESDNLCLVAKSSRCKCITDLICLSIVKSEALKLRPFEIGLINTLRKLVLSDSNSKDMRSITLNEFNTFWSELPEEERHSSESTIAALPHPSSLLDSSTLALIDDQAEFDHIMRIILELEDKDEITQLFRGLNLLSARKILSMSYKELWSLSFTPLDSEDSLCFE